VSDWRKRNARALLREFQAHGLAANVRLTNFAGEDLRGQVFTPDDDLAGADFGDADLTDARLQGVCLAGANLSRARLTGALLDGADLTGADLTGGCLDSASLIGADLTGANLTGTTWRRARLTKAQIPSGAVVDGWGMAAPDQALRLQIPPSVVPVSSITWHRDGDLLATADGKFVRIWDLDTGTLINSLTGHEGAVTMAAFSPDGTRLATGGDDSTARIWDPATGTLHTTLTGHEATVNAEAFSPDGTRLATGSSDRTVRIWDPATGTLHTTLTGHSGRVSAVVFSPDGTRLATGSDDGAFLLTDPEVLKVSVPRPWRRLLFKLIRKRPRPGTARLGNSINAPGDAITSIAYSPDGAIIATGHSAGFISLKPAESDSGYSPVRLMGLPGSGWAVLHGEHRYELHGVPAGRFWWAAGLCRFEPGEADGYGVECVQGIGRLSL